MNKLSLFQLVMWVVFPALFMACGGRSPVSRDAASLTVIDVESALAHLEDELTLSDLYDTVCYVPLETSDSCLVGAYPSVRVVDGCIVVSSYSGTALCHSFDAQTGRSGVKESPERITFFAHAIFTARNRTTTSGYTNAIAARFAWHLRTVRSAMTLPASCPTRLPLSKHTK